jgi:hypothetical protein|tara:strand:+ start:5960 stop:6514 length:555 start_codon:yes stop_codon:yes gene_type:complete
MNGTEVNAISGVFISALAKFGTILLFGAFLGIPIIIGGLFVAMSMLYKHKVVIHEPLGRISFAKAMITKKGQMILRKPKFRIEAFDVEMCSLDNKGRYVFHFFKENNNSYRQLKPVHVDKDLKNLVHMAEDKGIDFLVEEWKKQQKAIFTLEGFEKYKDMVFLGFIIVFNIVSMGMLFNAAGLQ